MIEVETSNKTERQKMRIENQARTVAHYLGIAARDAKILAYMVNNPDCAETANLILQFQETQKALNELKNKYDNGRI